MQATTRNVDSTAGIGRKLSRGAGLLGFGAVLFLVLGASTARADDYFERGFENELGRLAARSIVLIGHGLLVQTPYVSYGSHGVVYRTPYSSIRYERRPVVIHHSDHHRLPHHRQGFRFGHQVSRRQDPGHGHGKFVRRHAHGPHGRR